MSETRLSIARVRELLAAARRAKMIVLGDVILDQYIWGHVGRISPEAPVPVVEFARETFIAGGAGNVARNLADLDAATELLGVTGKDDAARRLQQTLRHDRIGCAGLITDARRKTPIKTRIIAHQQQVCRVDRETRGDLDAPLAKRLLAALDKKLRGADALVICDYAKGVVTQALLEGARRLCARRGVWLSVDPKPAHALDLSGARLLTPNRKEAFELARVTDDPRGEAPMKDAPLQRVAKLLLDQFRPELLLITLGEQGLLLCQPGKPPFHAPTVARQVFDVSGAGDTIIASFTLAIAAGANPREAAIFANHAAGIVVGKVGAATARPEELLASFQTGTGILLEERRGK